MDETGSRRVTHYYGDDCPGGHLEHIDLEEATKATDRIPTDKDRQRDSAGDAVRRARTFPPKPHAPIKGYDFSRYEAFRSLFKSEAEKAEREEQEAEESWTPEEPDLDSDTW